MATPKDRVLQRIAKSKAQAATIHTPYIRTVPGSKFAIDQTLCKGCGSVIAALIPHDRFPDRLIYAALPLYEVVRIVFDDGSAHETPMCRTCARRLTVADLEHVYAADLAQWEQEERDGGGKHRWDTLADRKPVRTG